MSKYCPENLWDNTLALEHCDDERDLRHSVRGTRQTFDCFNCHWHADRAYCIKGHQFGSAKDGTMYLKAILRGTTARICHTCLDFSGDENNAILSEGKKEGK